MDTRRYYNRYQRTMPSATQRQQITVTTENTDNCLNPTSLAMVYAPEHCFGDLYDLTSALNYGTIFRNLNLQFMGKRC